MILKTLPFSFEMAKKLFFYQEEEQQHQIRKVQEKE